MTIISYFKNKLCDAAKKHRCSIHAYVLMANHIHLLVTPDSSICISKMMQMLGRYYVQNQSGENQSSLTFLFLGSYPEYVQLSDDLNARRFEIPVEQWKKMTPEKQWTANQKFLDRTITRDDNIVLSNNAHQAKLGIEKSSICNRKAILFQIMV